MPLTPGDKIEIADLCSRYALAVDQNDIEAWLTTWTEDGEMDASFGSAKGAVQLRALEERAQGGSSKGKRHVVANLATEGDGNHATATSYLVIFERKKSPAVVATAVYKDTLRKVDGRWKFARRELRTDGT